MMEVLPRNKISPAAIKLAEALHHEARLERIHTIIELAFQEEREKAYFDGLFGPSEKENEGPHSDDQSRSNP